MEKIFDELSEYYHEDDFDKIIAHKYGIYFLKMRSLSRKKFLIKLANKANIKIENFSANELFKYLFCQRIDENLLNNFILEVYQQERKNRKFNEEDIYNQLYRLPVLYWGGFYQNAVEKTIVNNYIKKIANYDELNKKIDNEINPKLRGYILSSWYNHWSSILIEDMFKEHPDILPAIGLVKKVDFFWHDFPFDLKVTYFPEGFIKEKRQQLGLKPELTELKSFARKNKIPINKELKDKELLTDLLIKISEHKSERAKTFITDLQNKRKSIIDQTIKNPFDLIKWFYENQGTRRFDAANRFFVVLIDRNSLEESWKLKRNKDLLKKHIHHYLNKNRNINFKNFQLTFYWEGKKYHTYATCLFISDS